MALKVLHKRQWCSRGFGLDNTRRMGFQCLEPVRTQWPGTNWSHQGPETVSSPRHWLGKTMERISERSRGPWQGACGQRRERASDLTALGYSLHAMLYIHPTPIHPATAQRQSDRPPLRGCRLAYIMPPCVICIPTITFHVVDSCGRTSSIVNAKINVKKHKF